MFNFLLGEGRSVSKKSDRDISFSLEKKSKLNFLKNKKIVFSIIIFFGLILLSFIIITFFFSPKTLKIETLPTCGDGTFYDSCSLDRPYFCLDGNLVQNSSFCGCPKNFKKQGNFCVLDSFTNPKEITLYYILEGEREYINFTVYEGFLEYISNLPGSIHYYGGEKPLRRDFKLLKMDDPIQREMLLPLVKEIQNLAPNDELTQSRIAISLVQNIPWSRSSKVENVGNREVNFSRYPYEVLYDLQGICGEKSELLAFLLREIGYGVSIFYYLEENHEAVGIKCPVEESLHKSGYCFIETSGPAIITDDSIEYVGGIRLTSKPEILVLSRGISLPKDIEEYEDAKQMREINNRLKEKGSINLISKMRLDALREKYGLYEAYRIS